MAVERNVPIAPVSTGAPGLARTLEVTLMQGDGSLATVEMQVVSIGDKEGRVVRADELDLRDLQVQMLRQLERVAVAVESLSRGEAVATLEEEPRWPAQQ